jgi:hypothetical protein
MVYKMALGGRMRTFIGLLLAASLAAGCGSHHTVTFRPPLPTTATPLYTIVPNAGTSIDFTNPTYAITANVGASYRIVWTGNATYSHFRGYVLASTAFASVTVGCVDGSCAFEPGDSFTGPYNIAQGGQEFDFDTTASSGFDGLDFVLSGDDLVYFYLETNDVPDTTRVVFTGVDTRGNLQLSNPGDMPFALSTSQ